MCSLLIDCLDRKSLMPTLFLSLSLLALRTLPAVVFLLLCQ